MIMTWNAAENFQFDILTVDGYTFDLLIRNTSIRFAFVVWPEWILNSLTLIYESHCRCCCRYCCYCCCDRNDGFVLSFFFQRNVCSECIRPKSFSNCTVEVSVDFGCRFHLYDKMLPLFFFQLFQKIKTTVETLRENNTKREEPQ